MAEMQDWRQQRRAGIAAIAGSGIVLSALWLAIYRFAPLPAGPFDLDHRLAYALKWLAVATLFCFVAGVEAVAHERLQSAAFNPLEGHRSKRLAVNLRYLQNTLEQTLVLAVALLGMAVYAVDQRAIAATAAVWIVGRFAFWIGYHQSAAMRGLGAPGLVAAMVALLYVVWRVGCDVAGPAGGWGLMAAFGALEAVLFWTTRERA